MKSLPRTSISLGSGFPRTPAPQQSDTKVLSLSGIKGVSASIKQNRSGEDFLTVAEIRDMMYYAVYDGHGCSLPAVISGNEKHVGVYMKDFMHHYIAECFTEANMNNDDALKRAIKDKFSYVDRRMHEDGFAAGSTCCIAVIAGKRAYIINVGDSHCMIFDSNCNIVFQSVDHKPKSESRRIAEAGGSVTSDDRVDGMLAMSRSMGDFILKVRKGYDGYRQDGKVICEPDISIVPIGTNYTLVLGTDGLFYEGLDTDAVKSILLKSSLKASSQKLVEYASTRNGDDDTAVIVAHI